MKITIATMYSDCSNKSECLLKELFSLLENWEDGCQGNFMGKMFQRMSVITGNEGLDSHGNITDIFLHACMNKENATWKRLSLRCSGAKSYGALMAKPAL